jgi:hypothetical protein
VKCQKIAELKYTACSNRQYIYNLTKQYFSEHDINSTEHADFAGIDRLFIVTGG